MNTVAIENLDVNNLSRLSSQQLDHVTCTQCCNFYVVPTTATCGHSLCHSCWRTRRTCPICCIPVDKKSLKLNLPLQRLKDHVQLLASAFEDLFNIKLDDFTLDTISTDKESGDSNNHVKEWLTSAHNKFSASIIESQQSYQQNPSSEQITSNIQIHNEKKKSSKSVEVVHIPPLQLDWDKIEEMPDIENTNKNEQNPIGPKDIESFDNIEIDKDYSGLKLRKSSRTNVNKIDIINKVNTRSSDKNSEESLNMDSKNNKVKVRKNWNNVKRMKKEFSKLNKKNRNKLNVSIEMCKKTQNFANKPVETNSQKKLYDIDDVTQEGSITNEHDVNNHNSYVQVMPNRNNKDLNEQFDNHLAKNNPPITSDVTKTRNYDNNEEKRKDNLNPEKLSSQKVCFFKKSAFKAANMLHSKRSDKFIETNEITNPNGTVNTDDIEITIKIGNTLTNICIKKKNNDFQLKINSDREVQTNLGNMVPSKKTTACSPNTETKNDDDLKHKDKLNKDVGATAKIQTDQRSTSIKKNTTSAETVSGDFDITESVEKELSGILKNAEMNERNKKAIINPSTYKSQTKSPHQLTQKENHGIPEGMEYINDLDIFDSDSVKEGNVQSLKATKNTPSAILIPTAKSNKITSLKSKRIREAMDMDDSSINKKVKLTDITNGDKLTGNLNIVEQNSENINYDAIMSQVFANIDADMGTTKTSKQFGQNKNCNNNVLLNDLYVTQENKTSESHVNQKFSENIFSMLEKDSDVLEVSKLQKSKQIPCDNENSVTKSTVDNIEGERVPTSSQTENIEIIELSTPVHDDDSDKSIVEETPQKMTSFSKNKNKHEGTIVTNNQQLLSKNSKRPVKPSQSVLKNLDKDIGDPINILSSCDTLSESKKTSNNVTVVEMIQPRPELETPITITKFVDHIKYKSTPMARKSLNFKNQNVEEDLEQTICPGSFVAATTTQEKEFMHKAFDQSQTSPVNPLCAGKYGEKTLKSFVSGSCLSSSEQANLKLMCLQRNWNYLDKYSEDLTHLVVGVDEENKSQRSVKYMCALAASKWIVSYKWVEKCLQTKNIVCEEPFEVLDGTGEPGPRRSRLAKQKLFQGITFYCMPPFSVLDGNTLKEMLVAAGGRVVATPRALRTAAAAAPALLLAEPERTQDDRFIYLAMELTVVPVNYEWALNCLGSYTLGSIYELLLCPASLLPPITSQWPPKLVSRDYE